MTEKTRRATSKDSRDFERPSFIEPMKALGAEVLPKGEWLYEIKFDGYRALGRFGGGPPKLWSRNAHEISAEYPEIAAALESWRAGRALVDGEIVALDPEGRPSFQLLQNRAAASERPPLRYYVFDLLWQDGTWLLQLPLEARQRALARLCRNAPGSVKLSPVFDTDPEKLLENIRARGLEGLVAKARGSAYEPGRRSGAWKKYRISRDQEFVIGGYTPPRGSRSHFGALLLGYYADRKLRYAGKVGTGFNERLLEQLFKELQPLVAVQPPFADLPQRRKSRFGTGMTAAETKRVTWLRPRLVAQIRYTEWTTDGQLRHPVFLGLRTDKHAREVVREPVAA